jgi:hypothetical protein
MNAMYELLFKKPLFFFLFFWSPKIRWGLAPAAPNDAPPLPGCKNKVTWQELGLYLSRYRKKWERMMKKNECDNMSDAD